jgi:hypothetical protein
VTILIGDTTLDVHAGLDCGARVVAVATGVSEPDELAAAGADVVLTDLADVGAFLAAIKTVRDLGPPGRAEAGARRSPEAPPDAGGVAGRRRYLPSTLKA